MKTCCIAVGLTKLGVWILFLKICYPAGIPNNTKSLFQNVQALQVKEYKDDGTGWDKDF